jgi:hypothetical protein
MILKIWNSTANSVEDALELPKGSYAANVGFWVQQSVTPEYTLRAARAVIDGGFDVKCASQAGLYVKAQELGADFTTWGELRLM